MHHTRGFDLSLLPRMDIRTVFLFYFAHNAVMKGNSTVIKRTQYRDVSCFNMVKYNRDHICILSQRGYILFILSSQEPSVIIQLSQELHWGHAFTFEQPHDKTNKMIVRPAKTQISLGIRPV